MARDRTPPADEALKHELPSSGKSYRKLYKCTFRVDCFVRLLFPPSRKCYLGCFCFLKLKSRWASSWTIMTDSQLEPFHSKVGMKLCRLNHRYKSWIVLENCSLFDLKKIIKGPVLFIQKCSYLHLLKCIWKKETATSHRAQKPVMCVLCVCYVCAAGRKLNFTLLCKLIWFNEHNWRLFIYLSFIFTHSYA